VPDAILVLMAGTAQQEAAAQLGARAACEIFANRAYNDDGTLVDRRYPGAVLHDPDQIADRIARMLEADAILTESGTHLPAHIDTICLDGDTPGASASAKSLRSKLESAGIQVAPFHGRLL